MSYIGGYKKANKFNLIIDPNLHTIYWSFIIDDGFAAIDSWMFDIIFFVQGECNIFEKGGNL